MNASVHSIVPGKIRKLYIIKYKSSNGDEKYAEMRVHTFRKNTVYLICVHGHCKAKLSLKILPPIVTKQFKPKIYRLSDQVTADELEDPKNYGPFNHICTKGTFSYY